MGRATVIRPLEDHVIAEILPEADDFLATTIRANFAELFENLSRLGDLYGNTAAGSHARAAAAAASRAVSLADRLR